MRSEKISFAGVALLAGSRCGDGTTTGPRSCTSSSCHGTAQMAGLDLRSGPSYASLVSVRATSEPILRVIPGDPDGSYLVIKLEGRQSVGDRMPQTGSPLDTVDLTNIRNWISQGALNN